MSINKNVCPDSYIYWHQRSGFDGFHSVACHSPCTAARFSLFQCTGFWLFTGYISLCFNKHQKINPVSFWANCLLMFDVVIRKAAREAEQSWVLFCTNCLCNLVHELDKGKEIPPRIHASFAKCLKKVPPTSGPYAITFISLCFSW